MAKVIKPFRDKLTWVAYAAGSEYEGGRVAELAALGFVVDVSATAQADGEPQKAPTDAPSIDYDGMTKAQLTEIAKERGVDVPKRVTKDVLIDLLRG